MFACDKFEFSKYPYAGLLPITVAINGDFTASHFAANADTHTDTDADFECNSMSLLLTLSLDFLLWACVILLLLITFSVLFAISPIFLIYFFVKISDSKKPC
jgi:hypothetical protein